MHVYRDPQPDATAAFGYTYRSQSSFDSTATVKSLAAAVGIPVADLLP